MTDRTDDVRLASDLARWFEGEVHQAALDLRRAPLRPARARTTARGSLRQSVTPILAVLVVAAVGLGVISRLPGVDSNGTVGSSATPTDGESPTLAPPTATPAPTVHVPVIGTRFDDGIPSRIDGEPVVRPSTIDRLGPSDDRPFLLGGWLYDWRGLVLSCPIQIDPEPFGQRCMSPFVQDVPRIGPPVYLEGWVLRNGGGPVVLRVHRHDAQAAACMPARREACEGTAVIDEIVWAGDAMTASAPLRPIEAMIRLLWADPTLVEARLTSVAAVAEETSGPTADPYGVPGKIPSCRPQYPPMTWTVSGAGISSVLVFPTIADREAVDQDFLASGWRGANGCQVMTDAAFMSSWVAVDNVMVAVIVDVDGPSPAQAALVAAVREALEGTVP